jgi:undecaprenyl-diphosphatase
MKPDTAPAASSRATIHDKPRWAAAAMLRETVREFRLAWITIPAGAKVRYAMTLGVGFVACLVLVTGMTFLGKWAAHHGLAAWDERMSRALDRQKLMSYQNAVLLESFGNLVYLIPLTTVCAIVAARRRRPLLAIGFLVAYYATKPIVALGWLLWDRDRPKVILDGKMAPPLHSYPSGHVALALSVYGILAYLWIRNSKSWAERVTAVVLIAAIVCITGIARLRLGTHWPSDVIAGIVIGIAWLSVVLKAIHGSQPGA